jgi:hypothetical protein
VTVAGDGGCRVRVIFDNSVVIRVASKTLSRVGDGMGEVFSELYTSLREQDRYSPTPASRVWGVLAKS